MTSEKFFGRVLVFREEGEVFLRRERMETYVTGAKNESDEVKKQKADKKEGL